MRLSLLFQTICLKSIIQICFLLSIFISLSNSQSNAERDAANEEAAKQSTEFIRTMPRPGGKAGLTPDEVSTIGQDPGNNLWIRGIIALVVMPLVIPILATALCPIWFCCRCCACCCCRKKKPNKKLSFLNIWGCYFFLLAISIVSVVFAGIAYEANNEFSGALIENDEASMYGSLLGLFDGASETLGEIIAELEDIPSGIRNVVNNTMEVLGGVDVMKNETDELLWRLNNTAQLWDNYSFVVSDNETGVSERFVCDLCTTIATQVGDVRDQIADQTDDIFENLDGVTTTISDSLVDQVNTITDLIESFIDTIKSQESVITDAKDDANNKWKPQIENGNNMRELAYNILFAIPILPIVFVLLGGLLKLSICFTITYILLWLSFTIMFILLALHLPIGAVFADVCGLLDEADKNISQLTPDEQMGKILTTCFASEDQNLSLLDAFGVDFDFRDTIDEAFTDLDTLGDVGDDFDFSALNSFDNQTQSADFTEFYGTGNLALETINNFTIVRRETEQTKATALQPNILLDLPTDTNVTRRQIYDLTTPLQNLSDTWYPIPITVPAGYVYVPDYDTYNATRIGFRNLIAVLVLEKRSISRFNITIIKIQRNLSNIVTQVGAVENATQVLISDLGNAKTVLFEPIFAEIDDVIDAVTCTFIGDAYRSTKSVMCGQGILGSLARIIISMMVIGFTSVFGCCASVRLVRKMEWRKVQLREEKQMKKHGGQNLMPQQQQPTVIVMQQPMPQPVNMSNMAYGQSNPYGK